MTSPRAQSRRAATAAKVQHRSFLSRLGARTPIVEGHRRIGLLRDQLAAGIGRADPDARGGHDRFGSRRGASHALGSEPSSAARRRAANRNARIPRREAEGRGAVYPPPLGFSCNAECTVRNLPSWGGGVETNGPGLPGHHDALKLRCSQLLKKLPDPVARSTACRAVAQSPVVSPSKLPRSLLE